MNKSSLISQQFLNHILVLTSKVSLDVIIFQLGRENSKRRMSSSFTQFALIIRDDLLSPSRVTKAEQYIT